ncbi:ribonuclease P protein component [Halomonas elongata]|uniref:Ribonuclease P protein component n=2 Tax=Halomonas elongata TaxID=2746 RepID=E1VCI6_HALED|nr:ribonuclease P protein component [Halomonas elongata]MBW5800341.1 ribonuclease P protein component [Halomonas elongata]OBX35269.1 ribonuclease P protein component [Halomonas elongata]RAW08626.1 ribonuclease P protein component [Halomonas elongata]WBF18125.1 ribonuclease P protein component [Halomonas elongata]WPU46977.1 ribonuclease P protein component [Halomonas elongata DSM 2581]
MSYQGFPRRLRLLTAEDYRRVFDTAAFKLHGKGLMALASPNELGHPRLGLIFSKKNVRRAVDRNRLKRITRESIRLRQHRLPAVDIVLLARRGVQELDNEVVHRQLHGMWRRLEREAQKTSGRPTTASTDRR